MSNPNVNVNIPFEELLDTIKGMNIGEKYAIWKMLVNDMELFEEEIMEKDQNAALQIREAREAYQKEEYVTIDEYINKRNKTNDFKRKV